MNRSPHKPCRSREPRRCSLSPYAASAGCVDSGGRLAGAKTKGRASFLATRFQESRMTYVCLQSGRRGEFLRREFHVMSTPMILLAPTILLADDDKMLLKSLSLRCRLKELRVIDVRTSSERRATNGSPASRESAMDSSAYYFREHQYCGRRRGDGAGESRGGYSRLGGARRENALGQRVEDLRNDEPRRATMRCAGHHRYRSRGQ